MNNYYIDASVYAYPLQENITDKEKNIEILDEYFDRLNALYKTIFDNKPRHIKYFLATRDFEFLRKCNLDLLQIDLNKLSFDRYYMTNLRESKNHLYNIYKILGGEASKYINFTDWFKILDIKFNSEPELSEDISMYIKNDKLRNNTKKNIAIIAALNEYIYKTSKNHKIILNNDISLKSVQITTDFNVRMDKFSGIDKNNKGVSYKYKIKDFPNNNVLQINNQNVEITKLDVLTENKYIYSWNIDHNVFLANANKKFKHLIFGSGCAVGLKQYRHKIGIKQKKLKEKNNTKISEKIEQWKDQFYDVLYANLEALNNFLDINNNVGNKNRNERYHGCRSGCPNLSYCGAHIRYFGVDCVDETLRQRNNSDVEKDRTINNKKYWLHLRPYNVSCRDALWFLGFRIYFRWISNQEIEIGWIGRHLYLPCEKRNQKTGKIEGCYRHGCPIYRDPNGDDYQNFLKQWQ